MAETTTEQIRVRRLSEATRTLVGLLSPGERADALVEAARAKQRRMNADLQREHHDRIRSGELVPATLDNDGKPYYSNGLTMFYQNDTEPLVDLGRVPGSEGAHVLSKPDGSLVFIGGFNLRAEGEPWDDMSDLLERGA